MPPVLHGDNTTTKGLDPEVLRRSYSYEYPEGLNLKPDSEQHEKLLKHILKRARESRDAMSSRYPSWRRLDDALRLYVRPEVKRSIDGGPVKTRGESDRQENNNGAPVIVMPVSYAALETLLVYQSAAFMNNPMFRYEGTGPEDVYAGLILEALIQTQVDKGGIALNCHTGWRDAFVYSFGAMHPYWDRRHGLVTRVKQENIFSRLLNTFVDTPKERVTEEGLIYEGNKVTNIDPYKFLPDSNVPIHETQDGEFVAWGDRIGLHKLLSRDKDEEDFIFNVRYLENTDLRSSILQGQRMLDDPGKLSVARQTQVDVIWMEVDLIPKQWEMGSSRYPEKWIFAVAADKVIIAASPKEGSEFDAVVTCPTFDGHSLLSTSKIESISAIQSLIDFLYSSRIMNIRKSLNDMWLVDPMLVNIYDLRDPAPGKLIRMRKSQWGRAKVDDALKQFPVSDVTAGNLNEALILENYAKNTVGSTDMLEGHMPTRGPRISAAMSRGAMRGGLSQMEHLAMIIDLQMMRPLADAFARNVQRYMEEDTIVRATGETAERLARHMSYSPGQRINVSPLDLIVDYDVVSSAISVPGSQDPELLTTLMQTALQSGVPEIFNDLDFSKLFLHIARQMGVKNVDDFRRVPVNLAPQVTPNENVEQEVDRGNLVPLNGNGRS